MSDDPKAPKGSLRVVVVGGGIAGAEAVLALRALAGSRVDLTLVSAGAELVLPALTVAEPFALGHAPKYSLGDLAAEVDATLVIGSLAAVDESQQEIELQDGTKVEFDALLIAIGARPVALVEHATTWWPRGNTEDFGGLLRDLEEGYTKRVAFVIPPGAVWPLPLYELALMTAGQASGMGIDGLELVVITPEAVPLGLFGSAAATALRDELTRAGIRLESATVARVERAHPLEVILQPTVRRLEVDRVVALPGVEGPAIRGTAQNAAGFISVDAHGQMRGSESVWAAGDAIAYPVKFGGLATQQADAAAVAIAGRAGVDDLTPPRGLTLRGVLMTGGRPQTLGKATADASAGSEPIWRPTGKVFGEHLTPYLEKLGHPPQAAEEPEGLAVEEALPETQDSAVEEFHALWRREQNRPEYLRSLGHEIHSYEVAHRQAGSLLREHGQLGHRDRNDRS